MHTHKNNLLLFVAIINQHSHLVRIGQTVDFQRTTTGTGGERGGQNRANEDRLLSLHSLLVMEGGMKLVLIERLVMVGAHWEKGLHM